MSDFFENFFETIEDFLEEIEKNEELDDKLKLIKIESYCPDIKSWLNTIMVEETIDKYQKRLLIGESYDDILKEIKEYVSKATKTTKNKKENIDTIYDALTSIIAIKACEIVFSPKEGETSIDFYNWICDIKDQYKKYNHDTIAEYHVLYALTESIKLYIDLKKAKLIIRDQDWVIALQNPIEESLGLRYQKYIQSNEEKLKIDTLDDFNNRRQDEIEILSTKEGRFNSIIKGYCLFALEEAGCTTEIDFNKLFDTISAEKAEKRNK